MKKILTILANLILCLTMLVPVQVFAENNNTSIIDTSCTGAVYITYKDTIEKETPILGAEFTMYKICDIDEWGNYIPVIEGVKEKDYRADDVSEPMLALVKKAYAKTVDGGATYTTVTNVAGRASFQAVDLGLYIVEETKPVADHYASPPFFVSVPHTEDDEWHYDITAEPKPQPAGHLIVKKTVKGISGETDRFFNFLVYVAGFDGDIPYKRSDGKTGTIKSGDSIPLKDGQSVEFSMIPVGCEYLITEKEANTDGYVTTVDNSNGHIMRTKIMEVSFINSNWNRPDTGDTYVPYYAGGIAVLALVLAVTLMIVLKRKRKTL